MIREKDSGSGLYIITCDIEGCKEAIEISAISKPRGGWVPTAEVTNEADLQGWRASITERGHDACPNHRVNGNGK
jgi:hypothetical protein